jgi:hypothetical protein
MNFTQYEICSIIFQHQVAIIIHHSSTVEMRISTQLQFEIVNLHKLRYRFALLHVSYLEHENVSYEFKLIFTSVEMLTFTRTWFRLFTSYHHKITFKSKENLSL